MNRILSILLAITWAAWIGGLVGLFIALNSLNSTFKDDRILFGTAASGVVNSFQRVELGLAAAALILTFGWRLCRGAPGLKTVLFGLLSLSTVVAVVETTYITPKIEKFRKESQTSTDEFKKMHGLSMALYTGSAGVLVLAGAVMVFAIGNEKRTIQQQH